MAFTWDEEKRRYRDSNGQLVTESAIKRWLDDTLSNIAALFLSLLKDYRSDALTFQEFFIKLDQDITALHYAAGALAFGGFTQMTPQDSQYVETFIVDQLAWFRMLATAIFSETESDAAAGARLAMYALAGYSTYENSRALRERKAGMLIERRILKQGRNCDPCIEYALRGWQLIGTLPRVAQNCDCRSNCRCHFVFSADLSLLRK